MIDFCIDHLNHKFQRKKARRACHNRSTGRPMKSSEDENSVEGPKQSTRCAKNIPLLREKHEIGRFGILKL